MNNFRSLTAVSDGGGFFSPEMRYFSAVKSLIEDIALVQEAEAAVLESPQRSLLSCKEYGNGGCDFPCFPNFLRLFRGCGGLHQPLTHTGVETDL